MVFSLDVILRRIRNVLAFGKNSRRSSVVFSSVQRVCDIVKAPTVIAQNSPSHWGNFPIKSGASWTAPHYLLSFILYHRDKGGKDMIKMSQVNYIRDLSNSGYRIAEHFRVYWRCPAAPDLRQCHGRWRAGRQPSAWNGAVPALPRALRMPREVLQSM